jgi:hypothetical protein
MREVIRIPKNRNTNKNPINFTHVWDSGKWVDSDSEYGQTPDAYDNVLFRGSEYGYDYFLAWDDSVKLSLGESSIGIFRGNLNSGKY